MLMSNTGFLTGKRVVVLGASSGLGLATAQAAAAEGAQVVIVSSQSQRLARALQTLPAGSTGHVVDLTNEAQIQQFFAQNGAFDHLVYTAGEALQLSPLSDTSLETARTFFDLRFWGALTAVKYATPHVAPTGSIVLTGGTAGRRPSKGWSLGASICSAMEGFTRAMAMELAPIRVNIVVPGLVRTSLWDSLPEADREGMYAHLSQVLPVQHIGEADDVAQTYLSAMRQPFMTGQALVVDGGGVLV
jgi:NAD(P)-dependent dehydrogenase (short-subunit alcohol dehydrogenase family)